MEGFWSRCPSVPIHPVGTLLLPSFHLDAGPLTLRGSLNGPCAREGDRPKCSSSVVQESSKQRQAGWPFEATVLQATLASLCKPILEYFKRGTTTVILKFDNAISQDPSIAMNSHERQLAAQEEKFFLSFPFFPTFLGDILVVLESQWQM